MKNCKKNKFKKIAKSHFQLLEIMVAVFILLVCATPTLEIFTTIFLGQKEIVRENERTHLAHLAHAKIVEQLYKGTIPIGKLTDKSEVVFYNADLEADLKKWGYECVYAFKKAETHTPKDQEKPSKYLVDLEIIMRDTTEKKKRSAYHEKNTKFKYKAYIDAESPVKGKEVNSRFTDETEEDDDDEDDDDS